VNSGLQHGERRPSSSFGFRFLFGATVFLGGVVAAVAIASLGGIEGAGWQYERFLASAVTLTVVIVPMASAVAYWTGYRLANEVGFVTNEVRALAAGDRAEPIPVRTLDEIGALTRRFEDLRVHGISALAHEERAKSRAEAADRFRTEFLTSISHELRTPLNAVLGFTDVLLDEIDGPLSEAQREDLEIIRNAGKHLVNLFNDVLDLSAAASGNLTLTCKSVDIQPILQVVARTLRGQLTDDKVRLHLEVVPNLPRVYGDTTRLRQVFANLVGNAVKFTDEGEVHVRATRADEGGLVVEVIDSGVGISPEYLNVIFDEFHQTGDSNRRRHGTGLGLSIARELIELHQGQISVTSVVGEGSTFRVFLPAVSDDH